MAIRYGNKHFMRICEVFSRGVVDLPNVLNAGFALLMGMKCASCRLTKQE
jgi:hypothetical protein